MTKNYVTSHGYLTSNLGRTMMEMLMVISLYGLLTFSLYKLISNIFTANDDSTAIIEISKIVDDLHNLYKWHDIPTSSSVSDLQYAMREGIIENSDPGCAEGTKDCDAAKAISPIGDGINLITRYAKITPNPAGGFSETTCPLTDVQDCQDLIMPAVVEEPKKGSSYYDCTLTSEQEGYDPEYDDLCEDYDVYIHTTLPAYQDKALSCADLISSCRHIFSLTLSGISETQCRKLTVADWGDSFYKISSNVHPSPLSSNDENYPFREIDIIGLCKDATSVTLDFF